MQLNLPIFPAEIRMINASIGVCAKDDFIYYFHSGSPIHCHRAEDRNSYRFILATLVTNNLCKCSQLSQALGIPCRTIERYAKDLREKGIDHFFNREDNRGQCYKFTEAKQAQAQELLNQGYSQQHIAKELGVKESTIRYHLRNGRLKKKRITIP